MRGFKVFNSDWTCLDFQYEVGKTFTHEGELKPCESGFHFCKQLTDCFSYYRFDPENKVAEIEATGNINSDDDIKFVTDEIKIIRELTWDEVLKLCNTGKANTGLGNSGNQNSGNCNSGDCNTGIFNSGEYNSGDYNSGHWNSGDNNTGKYNSGNLNSGFHNSGYRNSGDFNSGYWNSGDYNSGDCNSGKYNSGDFNSGNYNTGRFNSIDRDTGFFNNEKSKTIRIFNNHIPIDRINEIYCNPGFIKFERNFILNVWVPYYEMSDGEKALNPDAETIGGHLKEYSYKEACENSWNRMSNEDKEEFKKLPNFNPEIFKDITGIDINE